MGRARVWIPAALTLLAGGCDIILGLDNPQPPPPPSTTTTTATGGAGGDAGNGAGGSGGAGGVTTTTLVCAPGELVDCYTGPGGTEGVGVCAAGSQTCLDDGSGFGPCQGQVLPGTEDCALPADEDCDGLAPPCKGQFVWAKRFGPKDVSPNGYAAIKDIATDSAGHVIVVGAFTQSIDFGGIFLTSAGISDVFVAKLNGATGATFWVKQFGDAAIQESFAVAVNAADEIVLAGHFQGTIDFGGGVLPSAGTSDAFLAKLDKDGNHIWSKRFGDADYQEVTGVGVDGSGNILAAGSFAGAIDVGGGSLTSAGNRDVFLAKVDSSGNHIWSARFGNTSIQNGARLGTSADGSVFFAGQFAQSIDLGGGAIPSLGDKDLFMARFDGDGAHGWSNGFGGADEQRVNAAISNAGAGVVLAGAFFGAITFGSNVHESAGDTDGFVAMLQADGSVSWSKQFGDAATQEATDLAADSVGNVILGGAFDGAVNVGGDPLMSVGMSDVLVAKLSQDGTHQWSKRFGDADNQRATATATDPMDNIVVGGTFSGTLDFGGTSLSAESASFDGFVVKFTP